MHFRTTAVAAMLALAAATAWGHGGSHGNKPAARAAPANSEEQAFGRAGNPNSGVHTIHVGMDDNMHFSAMASAPPQRKTDVASAERAHFMPGEIVVKRGETVRFVVRNHGKVMHEMVIGTMKELKEHAELMRKFPDMEHDEPYMAHVAPGKQGEIVWQFSQAGEFYYACLVPGHMEAGMVAKITVK